MLQAAPEMASGRASRLPASPARSRVAALAGGVSASGGGAAGQAAVLRDLDVLLAKVQQVRRAAAETEQDDKAGLVAAERERALVQEELVALEQQVRASSIGKHRLPSSFWPGSPRISHAGGRTAHRGQPGCWQAHRADRDDALAG